MKLLFTFSLLCMSALTYAQTGNTVIGQNADSKLNPGDFTLAYNGSAAHGLILSDRNSPIGYIAGGYLTASELRVIEPEKGFSNIKGDKNTLMGHSAGMSSTTGNDGLSSAGVAIYAAPDINIKENGVNIRSGGSVNFGNVELTGASKIKTFTLENLGDEVLEVVPSSSGIYAEYYDGDFTLNFPNEYHVEPSESITFQITFDPTFYGTTSAIAVIVNNSPREAPYDIYLRGTGTCTPVSNTGQLLTWTGAKNTTWNDVCNWSPMLVPTANNDVTIPSAPANQPTLSVNNAVAKSVEVLSGATFTIGTNGQLTINNSKSFTVSTDTRTSAFLNLGTVVNNGKIILGSATFIGEHGFWNNGTFNNNTGGEISIDNSTRNGLYNRSGTFTNAAKISIGANGSVGFNGLENQAIFNNNAGGEINIDGSSSNGLDNVSGTFNNAAKISIGANGSVGFNGLENQAIFNNNAGGEINIDGSSIKGLRNTLGTFSNAAKITIGANASIGSEGLENQAIFNNNTGGELRIDRSLTKGLHNYSGTFTNAAKIIIGANANVGFNGLENRATFKNNIGGEINIDRTNQNGLFNRLGTFTNAAKITIGRNASGGDDGLQNRATFNNNMGGELSIDNSTFNGLYNYSGTFTNVAKITIGANASGGHNGLGNQAFFNNNTGGEINIDRSNQKGIYNYGNGGTFNNTGLLTLGANAGVGLDAIYNEATFNNNVCGEVVVHRAIINNTSMNTYTNTGLTYLASELKNDGTFTNYGVLKYGSTTGNAISNATASSIIVKDNPTPIFTYGGTYDGTINGIYTDTTATTPAGTFSTPNNFIPNNSLPAGLQTLYASITQSGCSTAGILPFTYNSVPEINLKGNEVTIANGASSPAVSDSTDFGTISVSTGSNSNTFYIINDGTGTLTLDATPVSIAGTHAAGFGVTQPSSLSIAVGDSIAFQITFDPSASGVREANVSIANNDSDENPYTFAISGTGTDICTPVTNTGQLLTWTGAKNTTWNDACNWSPTLVPTATNDVDIPNTSVKPTINVNNGVAKTVQVQTSATLTIGTSGQLTINGSRDFQGFQTGFGNLGTLENSGRLVIGDISSVGEMAFYNAGTFNNNAGGEITLDKGTYSTLWNAAGNITNGGKIAIESTSERSFVNQDGGFTNNLCGSLLIPAGGLFHVGSVDITNNGYLLVGKTLEKDANVTNNGALKYKSLTGSGSLVNAQNPSVIVNDNPTPIFTYGGTYDGTINGIYTDTTATTTAGTFSTPNNFIPNNSLPAGLQTLYASITQSGCSTAGILPFTYNSVPEINLKGNEVTIANGASSPAVSDSTDFGTISVSTGSNSNTFYIINDGTGTLTLDATPVSIAGTHSVDFSVTQPSFLSIAVGDSIAFQITFDPSASGVREANVSIANNDSDENPYTFAISGTGTNICTPVTNTGQRLTWTGAKNTTWNDACNWSPTLVPTATNDVVIPNTTIKPTINVNNGVAKTVQVQRSARLTISTSGQLTVNGSRNFLGIQTGFGNIGTIENSGRLVIGNISSAGEAAIYNAGTFNNNVGGELTVNRGSFYGIYNTGSITNRGKITIESTLVRSLVNNHGSFTNNLCGSLLIPVGGLLHVGPAGFSNNGYLLVGKTLEINANLTNNGALKYKNLTGSGSLVNAQNASVIVNDNPTPIFTYGGTFDGTVNGIFINDSVTTAGTFTAPNSFIPNSSLPTGLQTLYASIMQSGCSTAGIFPFTYNSVPEINLKGNGVTIANGASSPAASDSTDFGTISVSSGSNSNTFYIINDGTGVLTLGATPVSIAGTHSSDFSVTQPSSLSIAVGDSIAFQITFDPSASGVRETTVSIANNDSDESPYTFAIQGLGLCDSGSAPTASISGTANLTCSVTSVTRTASGGTSYSWSNSLGTNATANITSPGTYTVTVAAANGCTATATTEVTQDATVPTPSISGTNNLSCAITSVTRTASGGVSYSWSGPSSYAATTAEATINTPGTYTVTVTGSNGCTATATTAVTQDATVPTASISGIDNLSCAITSVTRTASGGVSYSWSGPNSYASATAEATINIPGTYTVTVTASNGCTATATTAVTQDATVPTASISGTNNLSCAVTSVTRTASGGVSYSWSGPNSYAAATAEATINTPGTYTVTVTGSNGCTATATTAVTQDATVPTASISGTDNLTCAVTNVSRTAIGGVTYSWSNGDNTAETTISAAGTYTVTVTASNGCTATATTAVTQDATVPIPSISGTDNLSCAVTSVTRTASGGVSYSWSGPNSYTAATAEATINTLGTYTVTVTASNGCTATATTAVTQDATVPTASISGTDNLSCAITSVTRTASGGASYSWSGPNSYTSATAEATINTPGTYTVTVTASNGCTATATTAVTQDATVPTPNISGTNNLSCAVTSVTRTASGGASYSWSNGDNTAEATISAAGTYTVTVTASNGCTATATTAVTQDATVPTASISGTDNLSCAITSVTRTASGGASYSWSNGDNTAEATISAAGTYTVTVTASNGCTATATTAVTQDASVPTPSISGADNLSCAVTSVIRTASGGTSYSWSGPNSYTAATAEATINIPGTYTVTVTASNGCTATATTAVTQDATVPTASISGTDNLTCAVTNVSRTASGGASYAWSNGDNTAEATISAAGTYTITVTGSNGCTATATTAVTLDDTVPSLSITGTDSLNCSVNLVKRTALGTGTYQWSNGLGTNATANITAAGTYTVTLTAANGCTNTSTTTVVFDNNLVVTASNDGPYEEGEAINLMGTGGPSYTWTGPNGFASSIVNPSIPNATSAKSGIYTVTVNNGSCTGTATTNVVVACSTPGMSYYLAYTDGAEPEVFSPLVENLKVQVSNRPMTILAFANCELPMVESARIHISGNGNNHYYVDNAAPYSLYELNGAITGEEQAANFYTFQFTGYNQANAQGDTVVGRDEIQYSIVHGNRAISLPTLSTSSLCAGTSLTVSGTESGNFPFYEGNVFQAFLSDENGNFGNQILIGSSSDLNSIVCTIPNNLPSGDNYKVVIRSSSPIVSSLASANLSIISASVTLLSPTNDILNGTRTEKATQTINAQNQIEGNSNVVYKAGNAVMLGPGFKAESGTVFSAKIEDVCVE